MQPTVRSGISVFRLQAIIMLLGLALGSISLLNATSVFAEDPVEYSAVEMWVQPEYDDPRVLVMIEGKVVRQASASKQVRFLVPSNAEMYSAGSIDAKGNYSGGPPGRTPSQIAGFDEIFYDLTTDRFRVEYYQDSIRGDSEKTIDFEFKTPIRISGLSLSVQQPLKATNMRLQPQYQSTYKADSFNFFQYSYPTVTLEQPVRLTINYTKTDISPSIKPGAAPVQGQGVTSDNSRTDLTWPLMGAIVIGAGLIAYYVGKSKGSSSPRYDRPRPKDERRRPRGSARREPAQRDMVSQRAPRGTTRNETTQYAERPGKPDRNRVSERSCPACRQFVDEDVIYCPYCGAEI